MTKSDLTAEQLETLAEAVLTVALLEEEVDTARYEELLTGTYYFTRGEVGWTFMAVVGNVAWTCLFASVDDFETVDFVGREYATTDEWDAYAAVLDQMDMAACVLAQMSLTEVLRSLVVR